MARTTNRPWKIHIANEQKQWRLDRAKIRNTVKTILAVLDQSALPPLVCELSLLFTDDEIIRELNRSYRNKDKATDILSFSQLEGTELSASPMLGDIVISIEYAARQAKKREIKLDEELLRLLIHGLLHLFGYDHEGVSAAKRQQMKRKENQIFETVLPKRRCA